MTEFDPTAGQWRRDDLPSLLYVPGEITTQEFSQGAAAYRSATLDHLNTHHPKPPRGGHDAQIAQLARMCSEADLKLARAERERDEWKARAEKAEAQLDDPYSQANQNAAAWEHIAAHPALRRDLLPEADHTYAGGVYERITQLAETAEAAERELDALRERVEDVVPSTEAIHVAWNGIGIGRIKVTQALAVQKLIHDRVRAAIEAEAQATDPVEELAEQIESATREAIRQVCADLSSVAPDLDPLTVERVMEVTSASRCLAAHVLGQEASDE